MIWTYETALDQLERCDFECEGGPLENNAAFIWLKNELLKARPIPTDGDTL